MKHTAPTLIVAGLAALTAPVMHAQAQPAVPEQGFLCCNMRSDGAWISDGNYAESGKHLIPLGTPVRLLGYGRYRVHVDIGGVRQDLGNDYSRDLSMPQFAARYIVAMNPKDMLAGFEPKARSAIASARVTRGMTRAQVLMALGYPISSETPHLDARQWRYWLWSFSPFTVDFNADGQVTGVTTDADTLAKVFMD